MLAADLIAIGSFIVFVFLGSAIGFGNGLKFITRGTIGKIISVIICYFLFGVVLDIPFVSDLLVKFTNYIAEKNNWFLNILLKIRLDLIVFAVALFVVVQIAKQLVVAVVSGIMNSKNPVMKVVNKVCGVILFVALLAVVVLIVFQILAWTTGVDGNVYEYLKDSLFGLDYLFSNNPLNSIFENIRLVN